MKPPLLALAVLLVTAAAAAQPPSIPDVALQDQNGRTVHFYSDLVKGKIVAINFIFTSCTTICSPMGANFAALQQHLGRGTDVQLISVTIDPGMDTPQRLKAWSDRFHAGPGWTLVTGKRDDVERVLRALGAYTPDKFSHAPIVVVGDEGRGVWTRGNGLEGPAALAAMIDTVRRQKAQHPAASYFGGLSLVDQNGRTVRLYDDLMKEKVIVIDSFFASCTASCPTMSKSFAALQARFGERLGRDLVLVSITVDPEHDTPARLKAYAARWQAGRGWYFLTGSKASVDLALKKLGQYVDDPSKHMSVVVIGNERTGLWKKAFGLAPADELAKVVESVLDDRG